MTWHCLSVLHEPDPSEQIHAAWVAEARRAVIEGVFDAANAVFRTLEQGDDGFHIYFSPAAAGLALRFGARPCARPMSHEIGMLVGVNRGWELNFPDDTMPLPI